MIFIFYLKQINTLYAKFIQFESVFILFGAFEVCMQSNAFNLMLNAFGILKTTLCHH